MQQLVIMNLAYWSGLIDDRSVLICTDSSIQVVTMATVNCDNENSTYLISENQCVKDQELLNGMLLVYTEI